MITKYYVFFYILFTNFIFPFIPTLFQSHFIKYSKLPYIIYCILFSLLSNIYFYIIQCYFKLNFIFYGQVQLINIMKSITNINVLEKIENKFQNRITKISKFYSILYFFLIVFKLEYITYLCLPFITFVFWLYLICSRCRYVYNSIIYFTLYTFIYCLFQNITIFTLNHPYSGFHFLTFLFMFHLMIEVKEEIKEINDDIEYVFYSKKFKILKKGFVNKKIINIGLYMLTFILYIIYVYLFEVINYYSNKFKLQTLNLN
jgi:hypothetical protein